MEPIELLTQHCKFEKAQEVYVLFGIARRKDNVNITNSQEVIFREVIRKPEDIMKRYNRLLSKIKSYTHVNGEKLNFYVYISVNPRDAVKATFRLKNDLNKWLLETIKGGDCMQQFKSVDTQWLSCLMSPECKSGRGKFLIDFDIKEWGLHNDLIQLFEKNNVTIYLTQETRNGYHIIVEPFDRRKFLIKDYYSFKIDSLLFVEYVEAK